MRNQIWIQLTQNFMLDPDLGADPDLDPGF
jgi:hypothetical protein